MSTISDCGVIGDWVKTKAPKFYNRSGGTLAEGSIVAVDLRASATETSAYATWIADTTPTEEENPLGAVVTPDATTGTDPETGIFAVAMESVADNAIGRFALQGVVKVNTGTSTAVTINTLVVATSGANAVKTTTGGGGFRLIGHALEAGATGTTATTSWVFFDGLNGFGKDTD